MKLAGQTLVCEEETKNILVQLTHWRSIYQPPFQQSAPSGSSQHRVLVVVVGEVVVAAVVITVALRLDKINTLLILGVKLGFYSST